MKRVFLGFFSWNKNQDLAKVVLLFSPEKPLGVFPVGAVPAWISQPSPGIPYWKGFLKNLFICLEYPHCFVP